MPRLTTALVRGERQAIGTQLGLALSQLDADSYSVNSLIFVPQLPGEQSDAQDVINACEAYGVTITPPSP
jgi:hypothetical protein